MTIATKRMLCWSLAVALSLVACGRSETGVSDRRTGVTAGEVPLVELMAAARIPGLTLAEIRRGEIVGVEVAGVADSDTGELVTEETLFEAASLSKPVFATVVLRLAERGELDLDRPLGEYLVEERIDDPRAAAITARMVLSHRSGLPNWGGERLELGFAPGERFGYSGEGYVYLERVVEKLTGLSLDDLARREIFEPLGMRRSRFSWEEGEEERLVLAVPHDTIGRPQEKRQPREGNAAASLHTTAVEYARFVRSWMGRGEPLLSVETRRMALAPVVRMQGVETARPKPSEVWGRIAWGLGWGLQLPTSSLEASGGALVDGETLPAGTLVWHWGDNGPFKAFVAFDPSTGDGIVYFANSANGLAIGRALTRPILGSADPSFQWAGYEAHDAPGWSERLEGAAAAADSRWDDAIAAFEAALVADPADEVTQRRIEWLRDLRRIEAEPRRISREILARYVGSYGPRRLRLEDGRLHYRRGEGREYPLTPLGERLFALEGMTDFRLEVALDETGRPRALIGHYVEGETDETPRG